MPSVGAVSAHQRGYSLFSVGESFWEASRDNSGTGRSQERLSTWRTQCPTPSCLVNRASEPLVSATSPPKQSIGSLFLKNWPCRPGPAGPPIASRSASEPRERRHRSRQKQRPAPAGAQDRPAVRVVWFSGPAGAVTLVGRDRGRSQSLAAARLTISAPSGSESAPRAM
jgi:hypothetical protein